MTDLVKTQSHKSHGGWVNFYRFPSKALQVPAQFAVFTPPQATLQTPLPVIYILAGLTCNESTFFIKSGVIEQAAYFGCYLVALDTSPRDCGIDGAQDASDFGEGASFYVDATTPQWAEHYQMATYLNGELPQYIRTLCQVASGARGIMGHSMGGHGALVNALRHPQFWHSVSAFAPITHPAVVPWGQKAFRGYFGEDKALWRAHDAVCLLEDGYHWQGTLLVDQGLADPFMDTQLQPWHLKEAADKAQQKLRLREHPQYDHSYWFVQSFIEDHMRHHLMQMQANR